MKCFVEGANRTQASLLPGCVEDYVEAENPVRVIEVFVEQLDLRALGFDGIDPEATGRPAYHPAVLLKIYLYGYLNRVQSRACAAKRLGDWCDETTTPTAPSLFDLVGAKDIQRPGIAGPFWSGRQYRHCPPFQCSLSTRGIEFHGR